jgi:lipopolysaccharide/colanic/teichoic acid biosynthesis glycosyltransferase
MTTAAAVAPDRTPPPPRGLYACCLKRIGDVVVAAVLLAALLPVMALVALAVRVALGRPVLHVDPRAGRGGRPIHVWKFRSMREAFDAEGRPLPDAERLGGFGRLLRRTSLDELPQLCGVLSGELSLVGPRPLPLRYTERYSPRQAGRLLVRPGLTGWAQIHGRNAVRWPERLEFDARYVEILGKWWAPAADLWIMSVTVIQIMVSALTGRGVSASGNATMEEFLPCH